MLKTQLNCFACIIFLVCALCTGCVSTSISDSLALIEQEDGQRVNKEILTSIQALRASQKMTEHTHTFIYDLDNRELSYSDKMTIAKLLVQKKQVTINIAPAKGVNKLLQLSLSMERAKALHHYIARFNTKVTIIYSPSLSIDTINLVVGA